MKDNRASWERTKAGGFSEGFTLLPPPPNCCQECAVEHDPEQAHNQQSLHYQYYFYGKHGRWPTWKDAIAHCPPELQQKWRAALKAHGVEVES